MKLIDAKINNKKNKGNVNEVHCTFYEGEMEEYIDEKEEKKMRYKRERKWKEVYLLFSKLWDVR